MNTNAPPGKSMTSSVHLASSSCVPLNNIRQDIGFVYFDDFGLGSSISRTILHLGLAKTVAARTLSELSILHIYKDALTYGLDSFSPVLLRKSTVQVALNLSSFKVI